MWQPFLFGCGFLIHIIKYLLNHYRAFNTGDDLNGSPALAYCYLVSRIGSPVKQPRIVDIRVFLPDGGDIGAIQQQVDEIVNDKLESMDQIRQALVLGTIPVY